MGDDRHPWLLVVDEKAGSSRSKPCDATRDVRTSYHRMPDPTNEGNTLRFRMERQDRLCQRSLQRIIPHHARRLRVRLLPIEEAATGWQMRSILLLLLTILFATISQAQDIRWVRTNHTSGISSVTATADGKYLVTTAFNDQDVIIWDATTFGYVGRITLPFSSYCAASFHHNNRFAVGGESGMCVIDVDTRRVVDTVSFYPGFACISIDGEDMVVGGLREGGGAAIVDLFNSEVVARLSVQFCP
jgi:hypothetical protein